MGDTEDRGDEQNEMGDYLEFVELGDNFNAVVLAAGRHFTCALSVENAIKCWGELSTLFFSFDVEYHDNDMLPRCSEIITISSVMEPRSLEEMTVLKWEMLCPLSIWEPISFRWTLGREDSMFAPCQR